MTRSERADVRNPVLALASFERLRDLPQAEREIIRRLLLDLAADAAARADQSWRKHKAPMAAYWKAVSVYARHIGRALRVPQ